jgi:hypothetical protein
MSTARSPATSATSPARPGLSSALPVALAALALGLVLCAMPWLWLGLGLGILAVTAGWTTYRHPGLTGGVRLAGAAASSVALLAVLLATTRVALSLAAVARLERML